MNNFFDEILCINLDRRIDRWKTVSNLFLNYDIDVKRISDFDKENIPSISTWMNNSRLACTLSHLYCLKYMINNNLEKLFVFEDDVCFVDDFNTKSNIVLQNLPDDWDMIYLGGNTNHEGSLKSVNKYLNKSSYVLTTHAYGISLQYAKKIIKSVEKLDDIIDCIYASQHKENNIYIVKDKLSFQTEGYSDIEEKIVNYNFLM